MTLSNLSQKQIILSVIGVLVFCILLVLLGNMYGGFLKTQVAVPIEKKYSAEGILSAGALPDPGQYTLTFHGRDASGASVEAKSTFEVTSSSTSSSSQATEGATTLEAREEVVSPAPVSISTPSVSLEQSPAPVSLPSVEPLVAPSSELAL